tara:strand:- start:3440 stop:3682 length:243 start_codon:yes stop_codon:yes gene_type:complete
MNVSEALKNIFVEVFNEDIVNITDESSQSSIENWDSLSMVRLMVAIENEFDIEFDILDISEFKSFGVIRSALEKKLSNKY